MFSSKPVLTERIQKRALLYTNYKIFIAEQNLFNVYSYLKVCSNAFVLGGNTEFSISFLLGLCLLKPEGFNKRQHHLPALDSGSTIPLSCFSVLSSCLENRISIPFPFLCHAFIHVSLKSSS